MPNVGLRFAIVAFPGHTPLVIFVGLLLLLRCWLLFFVVVLLLLLIKFVLPHAVILENSLNHTKKDFNFDNQITTQLAFSLEPLLARQQNAILMAFRWRAESGPFYLLAVYAVFYII